jgi:DNA-directed RNA polymerase subunit M/transcription elongation factor TFIIS
MSFDKALGGASRQKRILGSVPEHLKFSRLQDLIYCYLNGDARKDLHDMKVQEIIDLTTEDIELMTRKKEMVEKKEMGDKYYELIKKDFLSKISAGSSLTCWKCGSSNIEINVKQTRSADEGSTTFCKCPKCNARWKMG